MTDLPTPGTLIKVIHYESGGGGYGIKPGALGVVEVSYPGGIGYIRVAMESGASVVMVPGTDRWHECVVAQHR